MTRATIYTRTDKGEQTAASASRELANDLRKVLDAIDGNSSVDALQSKLNFRDGGWLDRALAALVAKELIREAEHSEGALDFTSFMPADDSQRKAEEKARQEAADRAKREAEAKARHEAEEKAKREAEAKARHEAEERARREAEAKARHEAEERAKREAEAKARHEVEEKAKREAEAKARREAEEKAKREAEAKARREAEEKAKREAEAKARHEAEEKAKREAEAKARHEAEEKAKREAEANARHEAEEKAKREAAERQRKLAEEQELKEAAERVRRKAAEAAREEAEKQAKLAEEQELKLAAERVRSKAAEHARLEAEEQSRKAAEEEARRKAVEEEARRKAVEAARHEAEEQARRLAEEQERRRAAERAREEAEQQARKLAEDLARRDAEEKARREAEIQSRRDAEDKIRREAEEKLRREVEEKLRREADEKARQEAADAARREAEEKLRREADEKARQEAEEKLRREADEKARQEAEEKARREADEKARQEAAEAARREADEKAQREAEEKARQEAEEAARRPAAELPRQDETEAQERMAAEEKAWREAEEKFRREEQEAAAKRGRRAAAKEVTAASSAKPSQRAKQLALGITALLVIGLIAIHLVSFDGQIPQFEQALSGQFQQPVKIKALRLSLVPQRHVRLEGVSIGSEGQIKILQVKAIGALGNVFSDKKAFSSVELDSPVLTEEGLGWLLFGKPSAGAMGFGPVSVQNATLQSKNVSLPAFDANLKPDGQGAWQTIAIESADKNLNLELTPKGQSVQIEFKARTFKMPFGSSLVLDELAASATASKTELAVTEFKAFAYGGVLSGNARLKWGAQWSLGGELNAKQVDTAALFPALVDGGRLVGKAAYAMQAADAGKLFATNRMEGDFHVERGNLLGVDLGRMIQSGGTSGTTRFAEVSGVFVRDHGATQLRQVRLSEGPLTANGTVEVDADDNVRGRFAIELRMASELRRANVALGGTLKKIEWRR